MRKMKTSRLIAYISGFYTLVIGIIMVLLSTFSIVAFNCTYQESMKESPISYMFHLFYYRSHLCDPFIDWSSLGVNMTSLTEPEMPNETESVTRTFHISVLQLSVNCLLVITSTVMLVSTRYNWLCGTRRWSYWIYFAPLSLIFFATNFIDMITGWYFSIDRFRAYSSDGTMTMLEITNRAEARPVIDQIDPSYRTLPPNIMLYVSLKGIAGIFINIVVLFFVTLTGWEVVDGSKRKLAIKFITNEKKKCDEEANGSANL
ncbi:CLUMA_CG015747, isoform A [Clunio marinus]|uniref:CLUMA_CG015747, isoform A n=1 Tax=Clunio marinus TaxID=568069 RepID=A0A1J1IT75_9DIPT|nr:CLUMA_CG015747, isoform A [Clunio marinus]